MTEPIDQERARGGAGGADGAGGAGRADLAAGDRSSTPDWRGREGMRRTIDAGTVVWGLILVAMGGWFFLDQTLGLQLPDVDWGQLWPVILIVVGDAVILQGMGRRRA